MEQASAPQPSAVSSFLSSFAPEISHLKGLALGVALGTVREMVSNDVPPHIAERLRDIIDGMTEKIGGETLPPSDFAALTGSTSGAGSHASEASRSYGELDTEKPRW
jgi:hypothetical protein